MRLTDYEARLRQKLSAAKVDNPSLCARRLVAHAANLDNTAYLLAWDRDLTPAQAACLEEMGERRANGEPLAYILGKKEFYSRDFMVCQHTLTPRPETELLVDVALQKFSASPLRFIDLGCGCGCIGLTLLLERPAWQGVLVDNKASTLAMAQKNAAALGLNCGFLQADIFSLPFNRSAFDLIISNPPYISPGEKHLVMNETLAHEPHSALFSPDNGMAHIKAVLRFAAKALKPQGWVILEHGASQGEPVACFMNEMRFQKISDLPDLAGLPRCALAQKMDKNDA